MPEAKKLVFPEMGVHCTLTEHLICYNQGLKIENDGRYALAFIFAKNDLMLEDDNIKTGLTSCEKQLTSAQKVTCTTLKIQNCP